MKHALTALMAALILAGNLVAQTTDQAELLAAVTTISKESRPPLKTVAALVAAANTEITNVWVEGDNLTYEQTVGNELIEESAALMANKVSLATGFDFAKSRNAWGLVVTYAVALHKEPDEVLGYVDSWIQAKPNDVGRQAKKLSLQASYGQDVRQSVQTIVGKHDDLSLGTGTLLMDAWQLSATTAGVTDLPFINAFLDSVVASSKDRNKLALGIEAIARKSALGQNMNQEILTLLGGLGTSLPARSVQPLYYAFKPGQSTNEKTVKFYDAMLRSIDVNAANAKIIRKIRDQKLKFQ